MIIQKLFVALLTFLCVGQSRKKGNKSPLNFGKPETTGGGFGDWGETHYDTDVGEYYALSKMTGKEHFFDPVGFVIQPHPLWERQYKKQALKEGTWHPCYTLDWIGLREQQRMSGWRSKSAN